jgi:opacity protein-like surface antigen
MEISMKRFVSYLLLMGMSVGAYAEGLNYTYGEVGYGIVEIDDADVDGDGFNIAGSFALTDEFHIFGGYSTASLDFGIDFNQLELGIGYNTPISNSVDVVATLAYVNVEVEAAGFGSEDDNGFGIGVGLRGMVSPQVELHGGIEYIDLSDSGSDTGFGAGIRYNFTEQFAVGLRGDWTDDVSQITLAGRLYF